jgi:ABC-type lipoprotein export system ATPase subunit
MIEVKGLRKSFRDGEAETRILDELDLVVGEGELLVLTGRSGSGKSTLLSILGALDTRYEGTVRIGGVELRPLGERARSRLRATQLGFVFQGNNLLPRMTALQNVLLPAVFAPGAPPPQSRALEALEQVGLAGLAQARAERLSGGEGQRVAIARALLLRPPLLLCDEPTGSLDEETAAEVARLFVTLQRERRLTVVVASHDPGLWTGATRTLRLVAGKLAALPSASAGSAS